MFETFGSGFAPIEKVSQRKRDETAELTFERAIAEKIEIGLLLLEPHEAASHIVAAKFAYETCLIQCWTSKDAHLVAT